MANVIPEFAAGEYRGSNKKIPHYHKKEMYFNKLHDILKVRNLSKIKYVLYREALWGEKNILMNDPIVFPKSWN